MATDSRNSTSEIFISRKPKKSRNRINATAISIPNASLTTSPNLIKPKTLPPAGIAPKKVPVLYYLTRNGHIEHPHLVDVPISSLDGLYLRDVMNALNHHRGNGMANMFSWSFKRTYKNGYVWHDLSEDDLIEPTTGHDYVLKGSELLRTPPSQAPAEINLNLSHLNHLNQTEDDLSPKTTAAAMAMMRRRNQSWSSFDSPQEYMVVKCESSRELAAKFAADAATQTEERRRRRSFEVERKEDVEVAVAVVVSPPPSDSSSEGVKCGGPATEERRDGGGRMKASEVLKQLVACGVPSRLKMQVG